MSFVSDVKVPLSASWRRGAAVAGLRVAAVFALALLASFAARALLPAPL